MHKLLKRLLNESDLSTSQLPDIEHWHTFLDLVDKSYHAADQSRYTLERSLEISSEEMRSLYEKQKASFEARQSSILNSLPDLLFLLDEDGLYLEVLAGSGADELYRPEDELVGQKLVDILPSEQAELFMTAISNALISGELQVLNYELYVLSGMTCFEGRVMPTEIDVNGKRTVVFLARDITDRYQMESQQKLLQTVLESATEGMVILQHDKKVLYANPAIEKVTGYSQDELVNEGLGFLRHEKDQKLCDDICIAAHASDHTQHEIIIHNRTGGETAVLISMDTLRNHQGRIEYFVGILTDITEIRKTHDALEHIAKHDSLTELPNRLMFEERLNQVIANSIRKDKKGALLFLDLDRFKNINDSLGHSVGDELLKHVAQRLLSISRVDDTVARFGGDEFVIVLDDIETVSHVYRYADKVLKTFSNPFNLQGYELDISTSIGISLFPADGVEPEQLIKQADTAMYAAKEAGRNRYHLFTNELLDDVMQGFTLDIEMRKALENGDFFLEYQPQHSIVNGKVSGFEALIRWQHKIKGLIQPNDFIGAAETTGLIDQIGLWVFKQVCLRVVDWVNKDFPFKRISFNLSGHQLHERRLVENFRDILKETGAIKYVRYIECEVTESAIIKHTDTAYTNLKEISEMGIQLAIDDFGTGHSSLINLKRYPLDRLKIDRAFVNDVGKDPNDEAIIRATVALAKSFSLEVVAEGVENNIQEKFLKEVGCSEVQGFYYNRPLSIENAELLLEKER